ncbi:MAG: LA_3696 family protein [bacterium]
MSPVAVSEILMERLGEKGAKALVDMLHVSNAACKDDVLEKTAERFERRLVEETSKLRVDMALLRTDLHGEIVSSRFELIKWNFVFWIGQVVALAGVISLMLRDR